MLKPALYDKGLSGAIPKPGKDAIVSTKVGLDAIGMFTTLESNKSHDGM